MTMTCKEGMSSAAALPFHPREGWTTYIVVGGGASLAGQRLEPCAWLAVSRARRVISKVPQGGSVFEAAAWTEERRLCRKQALGTSKPGRWVELQLASAGRPFLGGDWCRLSAPNRA